MERERVSLGLKQATPNPWDNIGDTYPVGSRLRGKVVNLVPYGAFVEIEPGIEGTGACLRVLLDQARGPRL